MDTAAELGRNLVSKHQIQPEYGDEQADAGRDYCRTCLARPNSQARTRTGKYSFFLFSWPRAGLVTLPGWAILLLYVWPYIYRSIVYNIQVGCWCAGQALLPHYCTLDVTDSFMAAQSRHKRTRMNSVIVSLLYFQHACPLHTSYRWRVWQNRGAH